MYLGKNTHFNGNLTLFSTKGEKHEFEAVHKEKSLQNTQGFNRDGTLFSYDKILSILMRLIFSK